MSSAAVDSSSGTAKKKTEVLPGTSDWENEWANGIARGTRWDICQCEPEFAHELGLGESGTLADLFKRGDNSKLKALVPGCGRGYPVVEIASKGIKAYGLDLSSTAMDIAQKENPHKDATYLVGDFFDAEMPYNKIGPFDLIFDSTFLCAISPLMWRQWAKRMNELIAPKGLLAMQLFPISMDESAPERDPDHPNTDEPGPPNRLTVKLVRELLKDYPFQERTFRLTPTNFVARGVARGIPVNEYWVVFQKD